MSAVHHMHHFFIRHGKTIYVFALDIVSIAGLIGLCLILTRWLTYSFPAFIA
ncbi:MAG: hypothetical protein WC236_14900 [Gallionellaceae bacterium]